MKIGMMSFAHGHAIGYLGILAELGVEIAAADPDRARADAVCGPRAIAVLDGYDALLDWGPDAVVIASENIHHRELTEKAAAAGAYVLSEKPLATSLADCRAMIEACDAAGVGLMTAFPIRFAPAIAQVAAAAHAGRLGRLHALGGRNPGSLPGGWFCQPELSGGGSVIDHTVHCGDLMGWMTGAQPATVYAQINMLVQPEHGVETGGLVAVTFDDGAVATIDASWSRLPSYPTWGGVTLEVVGSDGVMVADAFGEYVEAYLSPEAGGAMWLSYGSDANRGMLLEFLAAVRERRTPQPDGRAGMRSTAIALAAYRSAAAGDVVAVFPEGEEIPAPKPLPGD
ncbi:MAG: Gfo/Idh/MocA family protein [Mycobacteriales bacterium]